MSDFQVEFYALPNGDKPAKEFIKGLDKKMRAKVLRTIETLEDMGNQLREPYSKHLDDGIWELRPGNNRVMFFYFKDDTFVLLHHFRKKTQKTPKREIEKAKSERDDWISRKG